MKVLLSIFGFVILKLTSSADDLFWLSKMIFNQKLKTKNLVFGIYLGTISLMVFLSYLLFTIFGNLVIFFNVPGYFFPFISSILLIFFAIFYLRNKKDENCKGNEKIDGLGVTKKVKMVFITSFVGSLDELVIFTAIFSSGNFNLHEVFIGTFLAGCLVLFFVLKLEKFLMIKKMIDRVQTWIVVTFVGIISFFY